MQIRSTILKNECIITRIYGQKIYVVLWEMCPSHKCVLWEWGGVNYDAPRTPQESNSLTNGMLIISILSKTTTTKNYFNYTQEDNPLVLTSQPTQWFPFGVWYSSFSSADIHRMNANMVQIVNQQSSIEIRNSGQG